MSLRENVTLFSQYGYIDSWHCRHRGEKQIITNNGCLKALVLNSLLQVVEKDWSTQQERPLQWEARTLHLEGGPHLPQVEKSLHSNADPAQPGIK